jgi:hypothetical protein
LGNATGNAYTFNTLTYNTQYTFYVITNYSTNNRYSSTAIGGITLNEAAVTSTSFNANTNIISFTASPGTPTYRIQAVKNGIVAFSGDVSSTSYSFTNLSDNTQYTFYVITYYLSNRNYSSSIIGNTNIGPLIISVSYPRNNNNKIKKYIITTTNLPTTFTPTSYTATITKIAANNILTTNTSSSNITFDTSGIYDSGSLPTPLDYEIAIKVTFVYNSQSYQSSNFWSS